MKLAQNNSQVFATLDHHLFLEYAQPLLDFPAFVFKIKKTFLFSCHSILALGNMSILHLFKEFVHLRERLHIQARH